jgi:hypothetical protein
MPVTISTRTAPPARGAPTEIDSLFVATVTASGIPAGVVTSVRSLGDYEAAGGTRALDAVTYDGLDNFFREGGKQAYCAPKAATLQSALDLFTEDYGGGQLTGWAATQTAADQQVLLTTAKNQKRFALLDVPLASTTVAQLTTAAGLVPATDQAYGAIFGPWVNVPAPAGVIGGTARTIPASSTVAALIARSDSLGNPNRAPAGRDFPLQYATSVLGTSMRDLDVVALQTAGLNPLRSKFGLMVVDGFQTAVDVDPNNPFWQANCARARMWMQWKATDIGLNYEYKPMDGRNRLSRALQTDLEAMCKSLWSVDGLYGDSPADAYAVTVDSSVNTATTIAYGELHAVVEARFSLHARTVIIELVTVPITGRVSA